MEELTRGIKLSYNFMKTKEKLGRKRGVNKEKQNTKHIGAKGRTRRGIPRGGQSCVAVGYYASDTNATLRSYSISHYPAFPNEVCPTEIIHLLNQKN